MKRLRIIAAVLLLVSAGCSGIVSDDGATPQTQDRTSTSTPTVKDTATTTETATPTTTPTATLGPPRTWNESQRLRYFAVFYNDTVGDDVSVDRIATTVSNDSMRVGYTLNNASNRTQVRVEWQRLMTIYAETVRVFTNESYDTTEEWIPNRLILTARRAESGERYATGGTNYTKARQYTDGELSFQDYIRTYRDSVDYGPGAPAYLR